VVDLPALWKEHQAAPFPASCLPLSLEGLKLVKIDAAVGAILTACLRTDGVVRPLDEERRRDLDRHRELISRLLRELSLDGEGKAYFARLEDLSLRV
jgi:hypothetical protein